MLAAVDRSARRARSSGFVSAGPATDADRWPGTDAELYELRVAPEQTGQATAAGCCTRPPTRSPQDGFHTLSTWALEADTALRGFLESSGWAADGARGELDVGTSVRVVRLHTTISE